ncbi:VOC family protein [Gloeobacter morelensis]|uniref:VOC family protein n=1 Tax=Gloeobacter morelensis MG652769 TaxID=2781736 RepID=A0ABY3PGU0_9CYAN|nr:VOC family protein [Gloeobacter morelensis]UFP92881.1 VOC family protein [Gloeobacter morelensis MG652769]
MKNPASYFEIPVVDLDRAMQFYSAVFGYRFEREQIHGNEMALLPIYEGQEGISGALAQGEIYVPSKNGSLIYLNSSDINATLNKVKSNGGDVLLPMTPVGELGFVAEFEDSEGNRIALFQNHE